MRPHKLTISGFLSYGGCEVIDFDQLATAGGLFLIHGSTGAGKTSILDAMAFALYGVLPGSRTGSTQKTLRSDFAKPATKTFVELEITLGSKRLKVMRAPAYEKAKDRGEGTTEVRGETKIAELVEGTWVPFSSTGQEAGGELIKMIGLDASQFFKLILLPQGDFAQFLQAPSKDREDILKKLFADEASVFIKISQHFKDLFNDADKKLNAAQIKLQESVSNLSNSFSTLYGDEERDIDLPIPSDASTSKLYLTALENHAKVISVQVKAAEQKKASALEVEQIAKTQFENSEKYLTAKNRLETAELAMSDWRSSNSAYIAAKIKEAELTEHLGSLLSDAEKEHGLVTAGNEKIEKLLELRQKCDDAQTNLAKVKESLTALQDNETILKTEIDELEATIDDDANPEADLARLDNEITKQDLKIKDFKKYDKLVKEIEKLKGDLSKLVADQVSCKETLDIAEHDYLTLQASVIAEALEEGKPCPVCGSEHHPVIAKSETDANKESVKLAQDALIAASRLVSGRESEISTKEGLLTEFNDFIDLKLETLETELLNLKEKQTLFKTEIDETLRAKNSLKTLKEKLSAATELTSVAVATKASAEEKLKGISEDLGNTEKSLNIASGAEIELVDLIDLNTRISKLKILIGELQRLRDELTGARNASDALNNENGADIPDLKAAKEARQSAENEFALLQSSQERIGKLIESLERLNKDLAKAEAAVKKLSESREKYELLSKHLNGETGEKVPLVQYYFGHRLQQILVYANQRLQTMSHGQFTLQPNHKQGGRGQNYLSISVVDAWNDGIRDATSLSGGESFTASLALAFGLADVVTNESGGKELESLFIDEGFGSLDPEYLQKVMESLYELRESGRLIGLISHVEAMKQDIPMQLLVTKQNAIGTTVKIVENLVN